MGKLSRIKTRPTFWFSLATLVGVILLFQNCAKKSETDSSSNDNSYFATLTPLDPNQVLKLVTDGASRISSIRQAAFNATYPNQNPGYTPTGLEIRAYDACLVTTNSQGSSLQSRPGKSCPFALSISTTTSGLSFHFEVLDPTLIPAVDFSRGDCSTSSSQSLGSITRSTATITTICNFYNPTFGPVSLNSVMKQTWDLNGASRLEDVSSILIGKTTYKFGLLTDELVSPAVPIGYSINDVPLSIPVGSVYPANAIWSLLAF